MPRLSALSALVAITVSCATPGGDRLNETVEAYIHALGGREVLEGIHSVHTLDSISMAGLEGFTEAWWIREPFMGRVRVVLGPVEQQMLFLGDSAFSLDRNGNLSPAGREGLAQLESAKATVFFRAFLENTGLEYAGDTLIAGEPAGMVRLNLTDPITYCFSAETGLPLAMLTTAMGMRVVQFPGEYSVVNGVTIPRSTRDTVWELGMESESRNILTEFNTGHLFHDSLFSLLPGTPDWELTVSETPNPFHVHGGHIYLQARVSGRNALAILDSGAGATLLDSSFAAELGLVPEGAFSARGIGGSQEFAFARVDSYSVAGAVLRGQVLAVMPVREAFLPITGRSIDMIIGYDFLSRFVTEIDYSEETITLHLPGEYVPPSAAGFVQGVLSMNLISFEAVIEDTIPVTLLLDTGAGGALHLTRTFIEGHGGTLGHRPSYSASVEGVGGAGSIEVFPVESITLGGFTVPCGEASVFEDSGPLSMYDGILGSDILSRFTLVVDYSIPGFHLVPGPDHLREPHFQMTGLGVRIEGETIVVSMVVDGSPAGEAGLSPGDTLLSVGGISANPDNLALIRQTLPKQADETVLVEYRSRGISEETVLTGRRLIP